MTPEVYIDFINKFDVDKIALTNDEILNACTPASKRNDKSKEKACLTT